MKKVDALKETIDTFIECVDKVKWISDSRELDRVERKAVTALQLAEVQVAEAGDDLYLAVLKQRRAINEGRVMPKEVKNEPSVDSQREGDKPRQAKRQTKKSSE